MVLCLVAAAVYSISLILQKPLVAGCRRSTSPGWRARSAPSPACRSPASWSTRPRDAPASSIWWLVYLGVFPTAIAFTTYAYALRHMSASSLGVTTYLVPPITIVMGLVFLGEAPPTMAYAGGALALVGVAVARRKPRTRKPPRAATERHGRRLRTRLLRC